MTKRRTTPSLLGQTLESGFQDAAQAAVVRARLGGVEPAGLAPIRKRAAFKAASKSETTWDPRWYSATARAEERKLGKASIKEIPVKGFIDKTPAPDNAKTPRARRAPRRAKSAGEVGAKSTD